MDELIKKIALLLNEEFSGCQIKLETTRPMPKIIGAIEWDGFEGMEQIQRQQKLWKALEGTLSKKELLRISAILTLAPRAMAVERES